MSRRLRPLFLVAALATAALPAPARLGETLSDLKKRFGAPAEQLQPRKDNAAWLFEVEDGQLVYSVTFNARGRSIAEGLKPLKRAQFTKKTAREFIDSELAGASDSPTTVMPKPGEAYEFAGQKFVCGAKEYVLFDPKRDFLILWSLDGIPSVTVVSSEFFGRRE